MTLKMMMIGAVLASGLIGAASQAKAEVVRVKVGPAGVGYVQSAPRPGWRRYHPYQSRVEVMPPRNHGYRPVASQAQNPAVVAAEIRAQMEQADRELRFDVRQGVVEPRALASLEADRREIERDLRAASANGYITAQERLHLEEHVQQIRDLRSQFRCAHPAQATYRR
jgi:hypothetical protein